MYPTKCSSKNQKFKMPPQLLSSMAAGLFFLSPPAAAAAETYRACSAAPLAYHFTLTSTPCNSFNVLKTEQQNDMAHSLGVEEADALVAVL
jgi:hypothetical protein